MLFAGALASQDANQDPIDLAFLAAAKERHIFDALPTVAPVSFTPFDATNRRTEALVEQSGQRLRVMKGAVRTIAEACGLQPPAIATLEVRVSESALNGYRTLAVARGPETGAPALLGLVTLYDARGSSGTHAITVGADVRDIHLCDGRVPGRERRREGRDDQVACARGYCLEIDDSHAPAFAGAPCSASESRLLSGSLNHATLVPPGAVHTPSASCCMNE